MSLYINQEKIKYAVEDRIKRTSRAINMLQGALSSCGNINVNVDMSLFEKQTLLTYGSDLKVCWIGIIECILIIYRKL